MLKITRLTLVGLLFLTLITGCKKTFNPESSGLQSLEGYLGPSGLSYEEKDCVEKAISYWESNNPEPVLIRTKLGKFAGDSSPYLMLLFSDHDRDIAGIAIKEANSISSGCQPKTCRYVLHRTDKTPFDNGVYALHFPVEFAEDLNETTVPLKSDTSIKVTYPNQKESLVFIYDKAGHRSNSLKIQFGRKQEKGEANESRLVRIDLYVTESDPLAPNAIAKILRIEDSNRVIITTNARVLGVRWKTNGPFVSPKSPAEGFVSLAVSAQIKKQLEQMPDASFSIVASPK